MKYIIHVLLSSLMVIMLSANLHAEEKDSFLGNTAGNIVEDFKYLATSPLRLDTKSTLITLGLIGVGGVLYAQDEQIRDWFQNPDRQTSTGDKLAYAAEKLGYPWALGIVGVYGGSGYLMKNEKMKETALLSFESFLVANSISVAVKYATGRSRPKKDKGAYNYKPFNFDTSYTAFPSGHATSAFSVAAVFADEYENPWVGVLAYGLASLSAWQRLYDDKHWATDVFAGAILGTVVGKSVVYLHKKKDDSVVLVPMAEPSTGSYGLMVQLRF